MRKTIIASLILLATALSASGQGSFSPAARLLKNRQQQARPEVNARASQRQDDTQQVSFVITCKKDASPVAVGERLKALGGRVTSVFGRNLTVSIPVGQIEAMANTEGVLLVDVGAKPRNRTDVTRRATQTDEVQTGTGEQLPQAYTGKGVAIGLIDAGFDFTHPAFKDKDGNLRIKGIYLTGNSDVESESVTVSQGDDEGGQTEIELLPGIVTDPKVILDTLQVTDPAENHGTHCAAIAAGTHLDGVTGISGNLLGGMAPEADLLLCTEQMGDEATEQLEDDDNAEVTVTSHQLAFMRRYAEQHDMPLVVSWSQNSHQGWHNGTSPMSQLVGDFCNKGGVMMLCTGNEGGDNICIHRTLKGGETLNVAPCGMKMQAVYYLKTVKPVTVTMGFYDVMTDKEICTLPLTINTGTTPEDSIIFAAGDSPQIDMMMSMLTEERAGQVESIKETVEQYISMGLGCISTSQGTALVSPDGDETFDYTAVTLEVMAEFEQFLGMPYYALTLHITPDEDAEVYSWIDGGQYMGGSSTEYTYNEYEIGSTEVTVGDYNTSGAPVSVGAWIANKTKRNTEGETSEDYNFEEQKEGDYAAFSSYGGDLAGHHYPDVCAPGATVYSALNSFYADEEGMYDVAAEKPFSGQFEGQQEARTYQWGIASGTSMSTPAAAGIVALWMQAANDKGRRLTCDDVKDILAHSCDNDDFTAASPERFGQGKINAYKGLLYVLDLTTAISDLSQHQPQGIRFRVGDGLLYAEGAEDGTPVSLYNLQGVCVGQTAVQGGTVSLAGLSRGVYAVQLGRLGSTLIRL